MFSPGLSVANVANPLGLGQALANADLYYKTPIFSLPSHMFIRCFLVLEHPRSLLFAWVESRSLPTLFWGQ